MRTDDGWLRSEDANNGEQAAFDRMRPSPARVYDYLLGGKDNFAADRRAAEELAKAAPEVYQAARANRAFLVRAVRFLSENGIRQFIDLGSGLPTSPNVHEVARQVHSDTRVVYVDRDPIVVAHGRALLKAEGVAAARADLRDPDEFLDSPVLRELIDFAEPVGVLAVAVLHFLDDHDSTAVVSGLREVMAAGSYLVISHASPGTRRDIDQAAETYTKTTAPIWVRTPEQIRVFFAGCELVEPGLAPVQEWRPDVTPVDGAWPSDGGRSPRGVFLAGVARIPGDLHA